MSEPLSRQGEDDEHPRSPADLADDAFDEWLDSLLNPQQPHTVYRFYDGDGCLLYVGVTSVGWNRLQSSG